MTTRDFTGIYLDNSEEIPMHGFVELTDLDERTFRLMWRVYYEDERNLAGKGRVFFHGGTPPSIEEIFAKGLEDILKFRIGRRKVFKNVKFV